MNMKTKYPSLSESETYKYDSKEIASQGLVMNLKHYYNFDYKTGEIDKAPLLPKHFDVKYYRNVKEGSIRWWLLEIRKDDYEFMQKDSITRYSVKKHEGDWNQRVNEWYFAYGTGVDTANITKEGSNKKMSQYKLKRGTNNMTIMNMEDAMKVGLNADGTPRFFIVTRDNEGEICNININFKVSDMHNIEKLNRLSERWWILERMRYDWGNDMHPVSAEFGMKAGDWKGILYKWMNSINSINGEDDVLKYHERGWQQWVQANYAAFNDPNSDTAGNRNNSFKHNCSVLSALRDEELMEIAENCPEYILTHMPPKLYGRAIFQVISLLDKNNRLDKSAMNSVSMICKVCLPAIKTYATTPTGCKNITITHVTKALEAMDTKGNIDIAKIIALKINQYNMLSVKNAGMLSTLLDDIHVYPVRRENNYSMFDAYLERHHINQFEWYPKKGSLMEMMHEIDESFEEVKLKYNLL